MTVLIGSLATALALLVAGFGIQLGSAAADRARAQAAADAAALAAVSELTIYGEGRPRDQALGIAEANGAELVDCVCEPASTSMQVTVSVDGIRATARAVFDPAALAPAPAAGFAGLHPTLARAVDRLLAAAKGRVTLVSGYRSPARQAELWAAALQRYGDPEVADNWVAPPGGSMHERGLAVDLGGDLELAVSLVEEHGLPLYRPLAHEPWHFELQGSRG